jgi:hypothetical protein
VKIKLYAYLSENQLKYLKQEDLTDVEKVMPHVYFSQHDLSSHGNAVVGTVEVDVELLPPDQIVGNAVLALRAKAAEIRVKATMEVTELEGKAQQLLAIENGSRT